MKNVLIVSALFPPEPVVSATLSIDIANDLSKNNNVIVISPMPSRPNGMLFSNELIKFNNFKHYRLKSFISIKSKILSRFLESYSFGKKTAKYINKNYMDIDIIYMNTWPIFAQYLTLKTAKKYSIPVITHIQDIYPESLSQKIPLLSSIINMILLPFDKFVLQNSYKVITISSGMLDKLLTTRKLKPENLLLVYNWQDNSKFEVKNKVISDSEKFTFMYVGSINKLANIESLILAFHDANIRNAKFVIAGEGPHKTFLIEFVQNKEFKNIIFKSFDPNDVGIVQSESDVLLLSLSKGASSLAFPSKIPAYMFSSKPILAFVDIPSAIANTITKANCGWVVSSHDRFSLSNLMKDISEFNKSDLMNLGINGKKFAEKNFTKDVNLNKISNIINEY